MDATLTTRCADSLTALEQRWAENACAPWFGDSREPAASSPSTIRVHAPLAALDALSVSSWALKGFDAVFGFNPLDKVAEFFVGAPRSPPRHRHP